MRMNAILGLGLAFLLAGCVGDEDTTVTPATLAADVPDSFLTYPNTIASLGAGTYDLEIGAASGAAAGSYRLQVTYDDGRQEILEGSWGAGSSDVRTGAIVLARAGGLAIAELTSTTTRLVLKRNGQVVASGTDAIDLPLTQISSATYAQAYYDAVDPQQERNTLEKWKQRNGFYDNDPAIRITHIVFRDALDLGYGRDMYVLKNSNTGRMAFMVNNYIVALQPGSSVNYGPLNVDAAISGDKRYFKGTNAIEFSPANEDSTSPNGSMKITKFFTFDTSGNRLTSADLDGRGVKHMPGMCWACHGGQTMPLDENGKFQAISLRSAKYNILGVAEFDYSLQDGYHRDQMEDDFRLVNSYVKESYEVMQARDISDASNGHGKWAADYGLELVNGRYNSDFTQGRYQDDFVPSGWQNGPGQENAELLFKRVVGPHCTACHSLQGREVAGPDSAANLGLAINFSSYTKFMAYRSRIADYVYRRGIMPMSLRNFENFWKDPEGAPSILAAALADPTLFHNGKVVQPGRPVARIGASRTVRSPVQLDATASSFAKSYRWSASSPAVVFSDATSARPLMTAPDGSYTLTLTVANSKGSDTETVVYTVDNAGADQAALTFEDDIRPILASNSCTSCHSSSNPGALNGIPVFWSNEVDADGIKLYQRVLTRIDLDDPENSRLLQRPTSLTHGGGLLINTATPSGLADYNTILNWIREGAVCGTDASIGCPQ
jgi:hypothetical protein